MRSGIVAAALAIVVAPAWAFDVDVPASLGTPVDLASLQGIAGLDDVIAPVGLVQGDDGTRERFYIAPIVGASWGQFLVDDTLVSSPNLFTAGGAAGVAITRPLGQIRFEGEGRYRDGFLENVGLLSVGATDNWSALFNVWRDFALTDAFGVYGGGGVGGGGYRFLYQGGDGEFVNRQLNAFAWQAGGGIIYAVSDRVTLDLGYRYYGTDAVNGCNCAVPGGLRNQFLANELLFAVRIYEPFRGLRR